MVKAKELFYTYAGNKFQMMRDGVLSEYESYNISEEIESQWFSEYIDDIIEKTDINEGIFNLLYLSTYYNMTNKISSLVHFVEMNENKAIDSNNFLTFTQSIIEIIETLQNKYEDHQHVLRDAKSKLVMLRKKYL